MASRAVQKYYPYFKFEFLPEVSSGGYMGREQDVGVISSIDLTESIISFSTQIDMATDLPSFSLVMFSTLKIDEHVIPSDIIKIMVGEGTGKHFKEMCIFSGMVSEVSKKGEYKDDSIAFQITGVSVAGGAISRMHVSTINEVSVVVPTIGWLPDDPEMGGLQFSGNTASGIARELMEKFVDEYAKYTYYDGTVLRDHMAYHFDSWTEDENLSDPTPFINYDGSISQFLTDIAARPFNEIIEDVNQEGRKSHIRMRKTPFDPEHWNSLPTITFKSDSVVEENFTRSDAEMHSIYVVQAPNVFDFNSMDLGVFPKFHESLLEKYGYKRLDAQNRYLLSEGLGLSSGDEGGDASEEGTEESEEVEEPTDEEVYDANLLTFPRVQREIYQSIRQEDEPAFNSYLASAAEVGALGLRGRINLNSNGVGDFYSRIWGQTPRRYSSFINGEYPCTYITPFNNKLHLPDDVRGGTDSYNHHILIRVTAKSNIDRLSNNETIESGEDYAVAILPYDSPRVTEIINQGGGETATTSEETQEQIDGGTLPTFREVESYLEMSGLTPETIRNDRNTASSDMKGNFEGLTDSAVEGILDAVLDNSYTADKHLEILRDTGASAEQISNLEDRAVSSDKLETYTKRLFNWNQNNANFRNGSIRVIGNPKYRVGMRAIHEDEQYNMVWEYYLEGVSHEFSLSNGYTTVLKVTRGLPYGGRDRFLGLWGQSDDFVGGYFGEPTLQETLEAGREAAQVDSQGQPLADNSVVPTGQIGDIVTYARSIANKRSTYVWGGGRKSTSPLKDSHVRVDCSSYVWWVFKDMGIQLAGSATGMSTRTIRQDSQLQTVSSRGSSKRAALDNAQAGDLIFWDTGGRSDGHLGIYLGNGRFVGAQSSTGVAEGNTGPGSGYWWNSFNGHIKRYPSRGVSSGSQRAVNN